jgi:serine/threonine-protein kinase SRPK3
MPPYNPSIHSLSDDEYPTFGPVKFHETEDIEKYEPSGFHPVHLGEMYDDGRYKIIHKLGSGGFSTVWLAYDVREHRYVALKIITSEASQTYRDSSFAQQFITTQMQLLGSEVFSRPLGQFWFDGPNGRHLCEVLPVLGPSISNTSHDKCRIRPSISRKLAFQAARALAYLHSQGLCHGGKLISKSYFPDLC